MATESLKTPEVPLVLIRPTNRLSKETINNYAGTTNGREDLESLSNDQKNENSLGFTWSILKDDGQTKSLTTIFPTFTDQNGIRLMRGFEFSKGELTKKIEQRVLVEDLKTGKTGITKEMILASTRAEKAQEHYFNSWKVFAFGFERKNETIEEEEEKTINHESYFIHFDAEEEESIIPLE